VSGKGKMSSNILHSCKKKVKIFRHFNICVLKLLSQLLRQIRVYSHLSSIGENGIRKKR
jgi:hypothetical protein